MCRKYFHCLYCFVLVFFLCLPGKLKAQQITDTIFFNISWQICERPMAAYYRIGTLNIDTSWFYTGKFKDYSLDGILLTEGEYSEDGIRNGLFNFYDTEGKLLATGNYENGKPMGQWEWKFTNGTPRAVVFFPQDKSDFRFEFYRDGHGKVLLEKGTGDFIWNTSAFEDTRWNYTVYGSFDNGKRSGTWKYYKEPEPVYNMLVCQEVYDKDGQFKKGKAFGYYNETIKNKCFSWQFVPQCISVTENIAYDGFFKRGPDSVPVENLKNYLLSRKAVDIVVKKKGFTDAFFYILRNLDSYHGRFDYTTKDIDGKIEFKIGDKATPENISITGSNITAGEKDFIVYLMSKFKNIQMPGDSLIAYEGYHTIYFYSLSMKEFVPADIRDYVDKDLFFSDIPKEQYLVFLRANKRKLKKYIRSAFLRY